MVKKTTTEYHHSEHKEWISRIDFYQDEIKIFQGYLSRVIQAHPDLFSIIEIVDEYRAILIKKLSKLDDMRHQIALHEHRLAKGDDSALNDILWDHQEVRDKLHEFEQNFNELKSNIRHFVSKYKS